MIHSAVEDVPVEYKLGEFAQSQAMFRGPNGTSKMRY